VIKLQSERGSILLAALAILTLLAVVLSSVMVYGAWHKARTRHLVETVKATYLAEAGMNHAVAMLQEDLHLRTHNQEIRIDSSSSFTFSILPWGGYVRVESTGTVGKTQQ
jgi:type II secretory pathway component PulK